MLFLATNNHASLECPYIRPEGKSMIKRIFSDENIRKNKIKIVGAYISCPKNTGEEHRNIFIIQADDAASVRKFFAPMSVDLRNATPLSDVLKTL